MKKQFISTASGLGIFAGALLAGAAISAFASTTWTSPSGPAPTGNVAAPLNIGATNQTKAGGSIQINGGFGIAGGPFVFNNGSAVTPGQVLTAADATGTASWANQSATGGAVGTGSIVALNQQVATTTTASTSVTISAGTCTNAIVITAGLDAFRQDGNNNNNVAAAVFHITDNGSSLPLGDLYFGSTKDGGSGLFWGYWLGGLTKTYYITSVSSSHTIQGAVYGGTATRGTATAQNVFTVSSGILANVIYVRQAYYNVSCI